MSAKPAYYNEFDPKAAQWLRNLIAAGKLPPGDVDDRSIVDVQPDDLVGYGQVHLFAGIGGWGLACRLAGFPDDGELWSASCPCQPFSVAGQQRGADDPRHLWPHVLRLVRARRPARIVGEQVAAAVGKHWLDGVRSDLEGIGYACRGVVVPACAVDSPQRRDRLWFVACDDQQRASEERGQRGGEFSRASGDSKDHVGGIPNRSCPQRREATEGRNVDDWHHAGWEEASSGPATHRAVGVVNDQSLGWGKGWTEDEFRGRGFAAAVASVGSHQFVECPDGKWRRLPPPRVRWLGNAVPGRVVRLRAYGNAIVPQLAAEVIGALMDCEAAA